MIHFIYVLAGIVLFLAMIGVIGTIALIVYVAKEYILVDIKPQETNKTPPKPLFKAKSKPTDEETKYNKILANIDAYDGSGKGQTKI